MASNIVVKDPIMSLQAACQSPLKFFLLNYKCSSYYRNHKTAKIINPLISDMFVQDTLLLQLHVTKPIAVVRVIQSVQNFETYVSPTSSSVPVAASA